MWTANIEQDTDHDTVSEPVYPSKPKLAHDRSNLEYRNRKKQALNEIGEILEENGIREYGVPKQLKAFIDLFR